MFGDIGWMPFFMVARNSKVILLVKPNRDTNGRVIKMDINLEGNSPAERWGKLRQHLKQLTEDIAANNKKLDVLEKVASDLRDSNSRNISTLQALSDLANEEKQREISLTLNVIDDDVVVDTAPLKSYEGGMGKIRKDAACEKIGSSKNGINDNSSTGKASSTGTRGGKGGASKKPEPGQLELLCDDRAGKLKDGE
jgi:hypothetical protein